MAEKDIHVASLAELQAGRAGALPESESLKLDLPASHLDLDEQVIDSTDVHGSTQVFNCEVDHHGTLVYVKAWRPKADLQKRPILIVHDLGEDHSFFDSVALQLSLQSIPVFCMDIRGHGKSGGLLGHVESFQTFVLDILQVAARIRHQNQGLSPYLLGCGTMALAVMDLEAQFPKYCNGCILLSPTLKLKKPFPRWRRFLIAQLMHAKPHLRLPKFLKPKLVDPRVKSQSKDPSYPRERTNRLPVSASLVHEVLRAIDWSGSRVLRLSKPGLYLFSKKDRIINRKDSKGIVARHKKPELFEIETIDSRWHNPIREQTGAAVVAEIVGSWVKRMSEH